MTPEEKRKLKDNLTARLGKFKSLTFSQVGSIIHALDRAIHDTELQVKGMKVSHNIQALFEKGLTNREIAVITGLSKSTVQRRLTQGVKGKPIHVCACGKAFKGNGFHLHKVKCKEWKEKNET